jgi:nitrate reductase gamma subunit
LPAKVLKRGFFVLLALLFAAGMAQAGERSWFIDPGLYHSSIHSSMGCGDCHYDMEKHPDPTRVNKAHDPKAVAQKCAECHDEVLEEIAEGFHAGEEVSPTEYQDCAACHDPHHQQVVAESLGERPDASKARDCSLCHDSKEELPPLMEEDQQCLACHAVPQKGEELADERFSNMCRTCHAKENAAKGVSIVELELFGDHPHADLGCMTCHPKAASYPHSGQEVTDCLECHTRHEPGMARDAHVGVPCQSCHLKGAMPGFDKEKAVITWEIVSGPDKGAGAHQMVSREDTESCRRCHQSGNSVGASAALLPAKSIMCMPCHAATLGVGDATTIVALIIFCVGLLGALSFWLGGSLPGSSVDGAGTKLIGGIKAILGGLFSARLGSILKAFFLDGLCQRRLWKVSPARGLIHCLIFLPFVVRFIWGLFALFGTTQLPEAEFGWVLIHNDHPLTAFVFDLTGVMVLAGVAAALIRRLKQKDAPGPEKLPAPDWWAMGLLLGIVILGFVLEGVRLAMTPALTQGAPYAFVAYMISKFFGQGQWLNDFYGWLWYGHVILTGAFVAYLPFSRMFHIILAPLVLAMGAADKGHQGHQEK